MLALRFLRLSVVPLWCVFLVWLTLTVVFLSSIPLFIKSGLHGFFRPRHPPRRKRTKKRDELFIDESAINSRPSPVIAFTGGGASVPYYMGILCFLQDHFDLSYVRASGLSCGTVPATLAFFDIHAIQGLEFTLQMHKYFSSRWTYCLMMSSEAVQKITADVLQAMKITNEVMIDCFSRKGDGLFISATTLHARWPFGRSSVFSSYKDTSDLIKACTSSMKIIPFYRDLERYRGRFCIDGGFTCLYALPEDIGDAPVIKITCVPLPSSMADIRPKTFLPLSDYFLSGDLNRQTELFVRGYRDASGSVDILLKKELIPRPGIMLPNEKNEREWEEWIEKRVGEVREEIRERYEHL